MTFQLEGNAAEIYEDVLVPLWFCRWVYALVERLALQPGERVLDVACGTGVTTRMAFDRVEPGGSVDGLDINAPMLAAAKTLADGRDIRWIESDVTDSGIDGGSYDVVLSQHGYHYFPDKAAALLEFRRLLTPGGGSGSGSDSVTGSGSDSATGSASGGRMAFNIWDGHSAYTEALCAAVARHISEDVAAKQRAQRTTPSADELADAVRAAGFSDVTVERQELMIDVPQAVDFVPLHLASMPIAGAFHALAEPAKQALIADVADQLQDHRVSADPHS